MAITEILSAINPWINSLVAMIMFVFGVFIVAKIVNRLLLRTASALGIAKSGSGKTKNFVKSLPDIAEYLIYVIGFGVLLSFFGIFGFALLIFLLIILLFVTIWLVYEIFSVTPNIFSRSKLLKSKKLAKIKTKYHVGLVTTRFDLGNDELLVYKNKKLLQDLNRGLDIF